MATAIGLASMSRNHAAGSFNVNLIVYLSGVSTLSIECNIWALALPGVVRKRSTVYRTSSAVSSRPFTGGLGCQRTPRLSLKTYVVGFGWLHDSARSPSTGKKPGATPGPAL